MLWCHNKAALHVELQTWVESGINVHHTAGCCLYHASVSLRGLCPFMSVLAFDTHMQHYSVLCIGPFMLCYSKQ